VKSASDGAKVQAGDKLVVAEALMNQFQNDIGVTASRVSWRGKGAELVGTEAQHPLNGQGYDFVVKVWTGDFVTTEAGTGFVHIAPGHGTDDYALGLAHNVEMPHTVGPDGRYFDHVPLFAGKAVLNQRGKTGDTPKYRGNHAPAYRVIIVARRVGSLPLCKWIVIGISEGEGDCQHGSRGNNGEMHRKSEICRNGDQQRRHNGNQQIAATSCQQYIHALAPRLLTMALLRGKAAAHKGKYGTGPNFGLSGPKLEGSQGYVHDDALILAPL
jgi:hypothetical protein